METLTLTDPSTGSTARILPAVGFNCFEFKAVVNDRSVDVLDAAASFAEGEGKPSHHGIPLLFPFPNRIRGGRYEWEGRAYEMQPGQVGFDPDGNAIHGFCLDRPWRVTDAGDAYAVGEFQLSREAPNRRDLWPADFVIEVRYSLRGPCLRADVRIANPDENALPWGFGTHPYFRLPLAAASSPGRCLIQVPAAEKWVLEKCLPTGERQSVSEGTDLREGEYFDTVKLDDVLTDLENVGDLVQCAIIDEEAGLQVSQRFSRVFEHAVVYTPPDRPAVCIEPYTCLTDAVNLLARGIETGWRKLPPGEEFRTSIEIDAGLVIA
ncbi:MAG: aldose 1-epimerase [Planctomycetes bacterium]|nr:aldose 1-epimerase [Planctomycetota bacterium]